MRSSKDRSPGRVRVVLGGAVATLGVVAHLVTDAIEVFDDALVPLDDDPVDDGAQLAGEAIAVAPARSAA